MEKYFKFDGVATRSEYWGVMIIATVVAFMFGLFAGFVMASGSTAAVVFGGLVLLATIVASVWASIATCVRRCRDAGINVWWTLGACIPYVGWIIAIVIGCLKTDAQSA